jgi:hypothetical protein
MANQLKDKLLIAGLVAFAGSMFGCARFQVVSPEPAQVDSQQYRVNDDDQIEITVTFNRAVDPDILKPGVNVILETEEDENAEIGITPGLTSSQVIITSEEPYMDLLVFDPDGFFSLRLLGSGDNPIRSAKGMLLDGDKDGRPGGVYSTTFIFPG